VNHIANWVTISDCANVIKPFGDLPVMACVSEEAVGVVMRQSTEMKK
jgi:hydroxyethylthiazole kinase